MLPDNFFGSQTHRITQKKRTTNFSYSAQKQAKQKPTMFSAKIKSVLDVRNKSSDRYNRRLSPQPNLSTQPKQYSEGITGQKIKNSALVSQLLCLNRKKSNKLENRSVQIKQKRKLASIKQLKTQLNFLADTNQVLPHSHIRTNGNTQRKNLQNLSRSKQKLKSSKVEQPVIQVTQKQMKDYAKYIDSNTSYYTKVNFSELRQKPKSQLHSILNISKFKVLQSVILCLSDNIKIPQLNNPLIVQYCSIYFQSEERQKIEVIVNHFYFRNFIPRVKSIYVYHRLFLYFIFKASQKKLISIQKYKSIALKSIQLIEEAYPHLYQCMNELLSKSAPDVMEGFRTLKIVKEIQRNIQSLSLLLKQLQGILQQSVDQSFKTDIIEIITNLKPFLGQNNYQQKFEQLLCRTEKILSWKHTNVPPVPYLPTNVEPKFTLVVGLNETLVYYNFATRILKYRPFMDLFIQKVKHIFELVIFSDLQKQITDKIVKEIEKQQKIFEYRLYKQHLTFNNSKIIKDISKLGRSTKKTIILDSNPQIFESYKTIGIPISSFRPSSNQHKNGAKQNGLVMALQKLLSVIKENPSDVREVLVRQKGLPKIPQVSSLEQKSLSIQK